MSACLSDMTLEVSHLDNQVSLQDVSTAKRRRDRALVVLAICAVDDFEGSIGAANGACR
jgi:hypothetical protein